MEDKVIVYVAGNPDAYPLEYYDADSQTYEGVIPRLLRQFSAESQYEVTYYQTHGRDKREHLAQNRQVDILSGYADGDAIPADTQTVTLFQTTCDGVQSAYYLCFTETASESLKAELETFLGSVAQEEVSGLLVDTAAVTPSYAGNYLAIGTLSLAVAVLLAFLGLQKRKYNKKLKKVEKLIEYDEVTGLCNLNYLKQQYPVLTNEANRVLYSLFYFSIDANWLHQLGGREEADDFRRYCASVLQSYAADTDILIRESDSGFVMLRYFSDMQNVGQWLAPILSRIREYTPKHGKAEEVRIAVGVYPLKADDSDLDRVLSNTSHGVYKAESDRTDYVICSDKMLREFADEKKFLDDIGRALERHEFQLYIQFFVGAKSHRIVGGESLSRWNHPAKGILDPMFFVPLMEREKLIDELDYYCLREVCDFLESLKESGVDTFFISCNFSRQTFASPNFVERCKEIIDQYHFPRKLLVFEITESAFARDILQIKQNISALKEYGVGLSLDDFGDGATTIHDLQNYPVDVVKLDKVLIDHIKEENGSAILRAVMQVSHELNIAVLAEGVETDEQVQALQKMDCDMIQGFRFYYPVPDWDAKQKILEKFQSESAPKSKQKPK